jgi:hypothetical protein
LCAALSQFLDQRYAPLAVVQPDGHPPSVVIRFGSSTGKGSEIDGLAEFGPSHSLVLTVVPIHDPGWEPVGLDVGPGAEPLSVEVHAAWCALLWDWAAERDRQ